MGTGESASTFTQSGPVVRVEKSGDITEIVNYLASARAGYVMHVADNVQIWLRAGLTFTKSAVRSSPATSKLELGSSSLTSISGTSWRDRSFLLGSGEVQFAFALRQFCLLTLSVVGDGALAGAVVGGSTSGSTEKVQSTTSGSGTSKGLGFGIAAGVAFAL